MTLQVGDKVVVWNPGTDWAFAKKVEPVVVGDTVDVITLSDGTKLSMPRIDLDLSDYVWNIPTWDPKFNFLGGDYNWRTLSLGAAVFTITGTDINTVIDTCRDWELGELTGCYILFVSGKLRGGCLYIVDNTETSYNVSPLESPPVSWRIISIAHNPEFVSVGTKLIINGDVGNVRLRATEPVALVGKYVEFKYKGYFSYPYGSGCWVYFGYSTPNHAGSAGLDCLYGSPGWPDFVSVSVESDIVNNEFYPEIYIYGGLGTGAYFELSHLLYREALDCADDVTIGDKYVIYNPETGKLMFNDAAKTILSAASWRAVNYPGEIVTLPPVEYVWDGAGTVYLSQSKITNSTIFYDNELRVEAFGDTGTVRAIDYHTADPFVTGGETVSRELVNITSILRSGKNYVQLKVRDNGGTKVGFPTPIYIKRTMDT